MNASFQMEDVTKDDDSDRAIVFANSIPEMWAFRSSRIPSELQSSNSSAASSEGGKVCFVCHEMSTRKGPCTTCNHFLCKQCEDHMNKYESGLYADRCSICKAQYPCANQRQETIAEKLHSVHSGELQFEELSPNGMC